MCWLNERNDFTLCDDKILPTMDIVEILHYIFPVDIDLDIKTVLGERYNKMRDNYRREWQAGDGSWQQNGFDIVANRQDALLCVSTSDRWVRDDLNLHVLNNLGHDLPVWCYYGDYCDKESARRIMIVSQDPLRTAGNTGDLLLSTPWGLHSYNYLHLGAHLPKRIIDELLRQGAIVYVTDFYKLYARENLKRCTNLNETNRQCLINEIRIFRPTLILVYGRAAEIGIFGDNTPTLLSEIPERQCNDIACPMRIVYHPTGTRNCFWRNAFGNNRVTEDDKVRYYLQAVMQNNYE